VEQQELNRYLQEIILECKAIQLPVSNYIAPEVLVNRRAKKRFGACKRTRTGFTIEISEFMLGTEPAHIRNILAHEVLHTCRGCQNHGKKWKLFAQAMNKQYGYKITTTSSYEKMGLERPREDGNKKYNYMIQCQSCGKIIYRQRKSKLITHTNNYRCKCGGFLKCYKIN
jgi:predicted SprT family Zn-dependent metalloprotease